MYVHDASYELAFYSMSVEEAVGTTYEGRNLARLPALARSRVVNTRTSRLIARLRPRWARSRPDRNRTASRRTADRRGPGPLVVGRRDRLRERPGGSARRVPGHRDQPTDPGVDRPHRHLVPPLPLDPASQPADARIERRTSRKPWVRLRALARSSHRVGRVERAHVDPVPRLDDVRPVGVPDTEVVGASSATQDIVVAADQHVLDLIVAGSAGQLIVTLATFAVEPDRASTRSRVRRRRRSRRRRPTPSRRRG